MPFPLINPNTGEPDLKNSTTSTTSADAPTTGTTNSINASATQITLLSSNSSRKQATVYNDSTADLYLLLGTGVSTSVFTTKIDPDGYYEIPAPVYTGIITGLWSSATGHARVTELT